MQSAKFFGKNVNLGVFGDYSYIGSASVDDLHRDNLIRIGESIAGPVNGPMLAQVGDSIIVLKV